MYVVAHCAVLMAQPLVCASCLPAKLCSTAGTAAEPACFEAPAADKADVISQQSTSSVGRADDAQVGSSTQEAVSTAGATGSPTDEAVATAGPADSAETAVSTAVAADTADVAAAVSEGTPEPAQASSPPTEAKSKAKTTPSTAETTTADIAQPANGASVPDASSVDAHQTGIAAADTAAAAATADKPVAAANNAAAADAVVAEPVVAGIVADAVAVTDAAAGAATSPASTDSATDAASEGYTAASEAGAASHDLAAAAGPKSESEHTTVDSIPSSVKQDQTAAIPYQLSSRQAFAAAQYATGMAAMTVLTDVLMVSVLQPTWCCFVAKSQSKTLWRILAVLACHDTAGTIWEGLLATLTELTKSKLITAMQTIIL